MTFRNPHVEKATQEIDAAIFSGDAFHEDAARDKLRDMMARWERGLIEFDAMADEENPKCTDCGQRIGRDHCGCPQES
jgi:hypothetical protein